MESDKKLATMEEELKLMKGELKQSLTSVRDYLLNMELPSSEFATVLAALGSDGEQRITMKGSFTNDQPREAEKPFREEERETEEPAFEEIRDEEEELQPEAELPPDEAEPFNQDDGYMEEAAVPEEYLEQYPEDKVAEQDEYPEPEAAPLAGEDLGEAEAPLMADVGLPAGDETPLARGSIGAETNPSIPKVNLLANLMHWVTTAKKDIGIEQLPIFLEVYGISGHLSPDLKELILHMADIASEEAGDSNTAAAWSRTMLSLHGILTGGDAPLHPMKSFWHEEESETPEEEEMAKDEPEQPEDTPFKLKLVLPTGNGNSQEFCLDLKPEAVANGAETTPDNKQPTKEGGEAPWPKPRKKR